MLTSVSLAGPGRVVSPSLRRGALSIVLGIVACVGAGGQTHSAPPGGAQEAASAAPAASAATATKQKRASRAKTPPGKPPRGVAECNQGDKAQRQRCIYDIYGPGGPRI